MFYNLLDFFHFPVLHVVVITLVVTTVYLREIALIGVIEAVDYSNCICQ